MGVSDEFLLEDVVKTERTGSIEETEEFKKAVESFDQIYVESGEQSPEIKLTRPNMHSRKSAKGNEEQKSSASPNVAWKRIKTGKNIDTTDVETQGFMVKDLPTTESSCVEQSTSEQEIVSSYESKHSSSKIVTEQKICKNSHSNNTVQSSETFEEVKDEVKCKVTDTKTETEKEVKSMKSTSKKDVKKQKSLEISQENFVSNTSAEETKCESITKEAFSYKKSVEIQNSLKSQDSFESTESECFEKDKQSNSASQSNDQKKNSKKNKKDKKKEKQNEKVKENVQVPEKNNLDNTNSSGGDIINKMNTDKSNKLQ